MGHPDLGSLLVTLTDLPEIPIKYHSLGFGTLDRSPASYLQEAHVAKTPHNRDSNVALGPEETRRKWPPMDEPGEVSSGTITKDVGTLTGSFSNTRVVLILLAQGPFQRDKESSSLKDKGENRGDLIWQLTIKLPFV